MKRLEIGPHANRQMWDREITITEAEWVLNNPELEWAGRKGATVMIGTVGIRRIKIVVRPLSDEVYKLITAAVPDEP